MQGKYACSSRTSAFQQLSRHGTGKKGPRKEIIKTKTLQIYFPERDIPKQEEILVYKAYLQC